MKVCLLTAGDALFEPLRQTVREAFPAEIICLSTVNAARWKESISRADLTIIDVTGANLGAFYALGIADALGKQSLLLSAIGESLPASFANCPLIVHGWNLEFLKAELLKQVSAPSLDSLPETDETPSGKFQK